MLIALVMTLVVAPSRTEAHALDELLDFIYATHWNGDLNSPLLEQFHSDIFGNGPLAFRSLYRHLQVDCQFLVPEPGTSILIGLFLTMGYGSNRMRREPLAA